MENQNAQKFNIGDKVLYHNKLYKITHIKNNGDLKLQSISGKLNEVIFGIPPESVDHYNIDQNTTQVV